MFEIDAVMWCPDRFAETVKDLLPDAVCMVEASASVELLPLFYPIHVDSISVECHTLRGRPGYRIQIALHATDSTISPLPESLEVARQTVEARLTVVMRQIFGIVGVARTQIRYVMPPDEWDDALAAIA
jgi:hypothetical protein